MDDPERCCEVQVSLSASCSKDTRSALSILSPGATTSGLIRPSSVGPPELQSMRCSQELRDRIVENSNAETDTLSTIVAEIKSTKTSASLGAMNKTGMFAVAVTPSASMFKKVLPSSLFMITIALAPAFWTFFALTEKLQDPRRAKTIFSDAPSPTV